MEEIKELLELAYRHYNPRHLNDEIGPSLLVGFLSVEHLLISHHVPDPGTTTLYDRGLDKGNWSYYIRKRFTKQLLAYRILSTQEKLQVCREFLDVKNG